jgi:hypothetical protein
MLCHYCACNCGVEISVFVTSVNACSLCSLSFTSISRDKFLFCICVKVCIDQVHGLVQLSYTCV